MFQFQPMVETFQLRDGENGGGHMVLYNMNSPVINSTNSAHWHIYETDSSTY